MKVINIIIGKQDIDKHDYYQCPCVQCPYKDDCKQNLPCTKEKDSFIK